jgi:hypothetical protein
MRDRAMAKKIMSFRLEDTTADGVVNTARAANMTVAAWLEKIILEQVGGIQSEPVVEVVDPGPDVVIRHGKAGHRHTTARDKLGFWCKDATCPHWDEGRRLNEDVVISSQPE